MPAQPSPSVPPLVLRIPAATRDIPATLRDSGSSAAATFKQHREEPGVHLLLTGDRDYYVVLAPETELRSLSLLQRRRRSDIWAVFAGRSPVRRRLTEVVLGPHVVGDEVSQKPPAATPPTSQVSIDLNAGLANAAPLFLLPDGTLHEQATGPAPRGLAAQKVFITAARWISTRRTSTFERLLPPSAFHPDVPLRPERLSATQAEALLAQVDSVLEVAAVQGELARRDELTAVQLRSAALTVLSHIIGTARKDPTFAAVAEVAAQRVLQLIEQENTQTAPAARPALRSHAIQLLQMRAPALSEAHRQQVRALVQTLLRPSPPYAELQGPWRFAMCSAWDFHEGECEILVKKYGWKEIPLPSGVLSAQAATRSYKVLQAPQKSPAGQPIQLFARSASPRDENAEMAEPGFMGVLINRHAQLGSFDMQASASTVKQAGYKLMMNSQCAGLTTRFAIAKMFPDADIYSSWDSTYFRTDPKSGKVTDSEGLDCFVAMLAGMCQKETHAQLSARIQQAQWHHEQGRTPGFVQFVGPGHPLVVARYSDVNQDGRADYYDGFLDLMLTEIQTDLRSSTTPRDPSVAATQIGGDAAKGLGWAAGSLNRVTQYSDLWRGLPGDSELLYIFTSGGFYSHREPPRDVPVGKQPGASTEPSLLPAVCRYNQRANPTADEPPLSVDVMFHSHLSHAAWEFKRLICAAEAMQRALDLGILPAVGPLAKRSHQRGAILLLLAGLLEFPADQNFIDGLWSMALTTLNLPPISRSLVRGCINNADHDASNYYGSVRGLRQLLGDDKTEGDLKKSDAVAYAKLLSDDPSVGRAAVLKL
jgi:hypothetical protein